MIVIIDYGSGNLGSVANSMERIGLRYKISGNASVLKKARMLILPGVGAAKKGMSNLKARKLDQVIIEEIRIGKPFLGICLGMQLLFERSEEGNVECLGIFEGEVIKFKKERKIPQIGWNNVAKVQFHNFKIKKIFSDIPDNSYFYFVNSYYCLPKDKSIIAGISKYGERLVSVIVKDNIVATQFHPEKSGQAGMQFLKNWRNLC